MHNSTKYRHIHVVDMPRHIHFVRSYKLQHHCSRGIVSTKIMKNALKYFYMTRPCPDPLRGDKNAFQTISGAMEMQCKKRKKRQQKGLP